MDVRCPNCQTEYELDEGRLKPAGVTVKCATCEHVFRVRRRASTDFGVGAPQPQANPTSQRPARKDIAPVSSSPVSSSPGVTTVDEEKTWLIRLPDGGIKVCREFSTLQRWIVSGTVTAECEISRTGKQWKPLSALKELATFFAIAKEARSSKLGGALGGGSRKSGASSHPNTVARPADAQIAVPASASFDTIEDQTIEDETIEMPRHVATAAIEAGRASLQRNAQGAGVHSDASAGRGGAAASVPPPIPSQAANASRTRDKSIPPPAPGSRARRESELRASRSSAAPSQSKGYSDVGPAADLASGDSDWAASRSSSPKASEGKDTGPSGPTGGLAKSVPVADAAFAGSGRAPSKVRSDEFKDGRFVATDQERDQGDENWDEEFYRVTQGGAGKKIVLLSVLLLAGAAAVMYFVVFKEDSKAPEVASLSSAGAGSGAGEGTQVAAPDATAISVDAARDDQGADSSSGPEEFYAVLDGALLRYDRAGVEVLRAELESLPEGLLRAVNRGRLHNSLAQHELDDAKFSAKTSEAKKHSKRAKKEASLALGFADTALTLQSDDELANATKADALRLGGAPSREVQRWLRKAKQSSESQYVSAMLRVRDKRVRDAQIALEKLQKAESSPRTRYRLALLALDQSKLEEARGLVQEILATDSEHEEASALLARIDDMMAGSDAARVDGADSSDSAVPGAPGPVHVAKREAEDYDSLLLRADKAAETGNCSGAVKIYQRALDDNPSGVAALTGLGYCQLDAKNYASAQARFRAALGISRRYQDALWGVAEGYQQQGLKDQAIKGYRKFIEEHPASRRSELAKRQIERLGGSVEQVAVPPPTPKPEPVRPDPVPSPVVPSPAVPSPATAPPETTSPPPVPKKPVGVPPAADPAPTAKPAPSADSKP